MKQIPNFLTLLNLACGSLAMVFVMKGQWQVAAGLLLAAAVLDFSDGGVARLLKAQSELGKQLDSLADMVSFGLLPAFFIYKILEQQLPVDGGGLIPPPWLVYAPLVLVPALAALRLGRFNLAEGGGDFFEGLPTPAHALFWAGLYAQYMSEGLLFGQDLHFWFLFAIMALMAMHMVIPVPMYSLKFKHLRLRGNLIRYLLILLGIVLLVFLGLPGLSLVILCYILLSLLNILLQRRT